MATITDSVLQKCLVDGGYLTKADFDQATKYAQEQHVLLSEALLVTGLLTEDILGQALAENYGVGYADLNSHPLSRQVVLKIPEKIGRTFRVVLWEERGKEVVLATDDPKQAGLVEELRKIWPNKKIVLRYALTNDIDKTLVHYRKTLETRFEKIVKQSSQVAPDLIDEIIEDALSLRASDIHFEPQAGEVVIRFRIDDILQEAGRILKQHYETIINRIKVMANLRTDEHFAAQDGAIRYERNGDKADLRVSIAPIVDGEKIAIRILSKYVREFNLGNLGLTDSDREKVEDVAKLPFGMVLVTGPTGSGKTTTLYSVIKMVNNESVNITTIEDPVEYKIAGVNHIQVNTKTELTFAKGLRSIVRQDPDIVLVGEIRDEETADIAVNAALTGHLLFSTFHSNDAATAIPRLLDMGVEPFLLASTLELVMAQRLVRKIRERDRVSYTTTQAEIAKKWPTVAPFFPRGKITLYKGKSGADSDGYEGRLALYELIRVTPEMEQLILDNPSTQDVWKLARSQGARSMFEDGILKAKAGLTTIEEVLRVTQPPAITK